MLTIKDRNTPWVLWAGFALLAVLTALGQTPWLDSLESLSLDWRFTLRGPRPFPQTIAVIGIDEASLDAFGRWPWSRDKHASLLQLLRQPSFRPRAIGYDILFEHPDVSSPESDNLLLQQASAWGEDLFLTYFFEKGAAASVEVRPEKEKFLERLALPASLEIPEKLETMDKVSLPYDALLGLNALGFANNSIDRDGRTRRVRLLARHKGHIYPSFTLLAAMRLMGAQPKDVQLKKRAVVIQSHRLGERVIPVTAEGDLMINYWGAFREIPRFSFLEILREGQTWMDQNRNPDKLKSLKGRLVLIGATALGLEDRRLTPFHEYDPSVGIQAQAIANILESRFLRRVPPKAAMPLTLFLGIIVIVLVASQKVLRALTLIFSLALLYLVTAQLAFLNDIWMPVANPLVTLALLFMALVSLRYFLTSEELRRTYAQLLHAEKMASLGTLSASIVHEYRNFLSIISIAAEVCRQPNLARKQFEESLDAITTTVQKASQVSQGLLTFARKHESVKKEGRLEKTIGDVLLILEKNLAQRGIRIQKELEEVGPVAYDDGQISQVLMNLLRNGADALGDRKQEKQITVRLKDLRDRVLLEIEDNGCGIPKQVLGRLFEPFVTSKPAGEGTGLGLSVCHGIIRNHGGDIRVKTAEGKGTTWEIFLPKK